MASKTSASKDGADSHSSKETTRFIDIMLLKGNQGLGFSVCRYDKESDEMEQIPGPHGLIVGELKADGPADRDGRMQIGDEIIEVNGQDIVGMTYEESAAILRATGGTVKLRVARYTRAAVKMNGFPHDNATSHITHQQSKDVNKNEVNCKNLNNLREELSKAEKQRTDLLSELRQINTQISNSLSVGPNAEESVASKLIEAESATKKAQRDMIKLQTSLSSSQSRYTELETQLRVQFNDLLAKYHETEDIVTRCRNRDNELAAEREKLRQRRLATEKNHEKQLKELSEKVQALEGVSSSRKDRKLPTVQLLSHSAIKTDSSRSAIQVSPLPVIMSKSSTSSVNSEEVEKISAYEQRNL